MFSRLWQGNNHKTFEIYRKKLRYIFLLHQTTTIRVFTKTAEMLCYIFLLHQTTTLLCPHNCRVCCVISFFYIKPQQPPMSARVECVVLYLSSTSNHNSAPVHIEKSKVVLYLSSTSNHNRYIEQIAAHFVVLYLSSTSNHNQAPVHIEKSNVVLYLSSTSNHNQYLTKYR